LLLPFDGGSLYRGYLTLNDRDYQFCMAVGSPDLSASKLYFDPYLSKLIDQDGSVFINNLLRRSHDLVSFFTDLKHFLEQLLQSTSVVSLPQSRYYERLMEELSGIDWSTLLAIDHEFETLDFQIKDSSNREHFLQVHLSPEYPRVAPIIHCKLPEIFELKWENNFAILDILKQFQEILEQYQNFWNIMDKIDSQTYITDPKNPTRADKSRTFLIANQVFLRIVIDPSSPYAVPECRLLGPESKIKPFKEKMNLKIKYWDFKGDLILNFENILETKFLKNEVIIDHNETECAICLEYKLGDEICDRECDGCKKSYHYTCLYEYFSNSSKKRSYSAIFGNCPYCKKELSVEIKA